MKTEKRTKTVEYDVYVTSDGKEFTDKGKAFHHESILKGDRKSCEKCKGTGLINGRYEKITWDYGHSSRDMWKEDKCTDCNGKGYLEKKWS